jgi:hypothetical protein
VYLYVAFLEPEVGTWGVGFSLCARQDLRAVSDWWRIRGRFLIGRGNVGKSVYRCNQEVNLLRYQSPAFNANAFVYLYVAFLEPEVGTWGLGFSLCARQDLRAVSDWWRIRGRCLIGRGNVGKSVYRCNQEVNLLRYQSPA